MPAKGGVDTTVILVGDYSNGNDALLTRDIPAVEGLKDREVYLVELSVSHYLLARALEMKGVLESAVKVVNTSDSDIAPAFISNKSVRAVVTWNPMVLKIEQTPGVKRIFDSAQTPRRSSTCWSSTRGRSRPIPSSPRRSSVPGTRSCSSCRRPGPAADKALEQMAKALRLHARRVQGAAAHDAMYWTPQAALDFTNSERLKQKMDFVRNFCFKHGLLGEDAKSVDVVGISYPDGTVQGKQVERQDALLDRVHGEGGSGRAEEVILRDFSSGNRRRAERGRARAPRERALHRARGGIRRRFVLPSPRQSRRPGDAGIGTDDRGREAHRRSSGSRGELRLWADSAASRGVSGYRSRSFSSPCRSAWRWGPSPTSTHSSTGSWSSSTKFPRCPCADPVHRLRVGELSKIALVGSASSPPSRSTPICARPRSRASGSSRQNPRRLGARDRGLRVVLPRLPVTCSMASG